MKRITYFTIISLFLTSIITACSIEKHRLPSKLYVPVAHTQKNKDYRVSNRSVKVKKEKENYLAKNDALDKKINDKPDSQNLNKNKSHLDNQFRLTSSLNNNYSGALNSSREKSLYEKVLSQGEKCDKIILRNGDVIEAKVTEVGEKTVTYKKCDNLEGPTYTKSKSSVFMIQYVNGTKDVFKKNDVKSETETISKDREIDKISLNSMILGIEGIVAFIVGAITGGLFWAILFILSSIVAFILGFIGLHRVNKNPDKYKGKGLAITGIILGSIGLVLLIIGLVGVVGLGL